MAIASKNKVFGGAYFSIRLYSNSANFSDIERFKMFQNFFIGWAEKVKFRHSATVEI